MSMWLQEKYVNLLASSLRNFKRKKARLFNCSCPLCGDSATDKRKARGYIYEKKGILRYSCHNCGAFYRFESFLKLQNTYLYAEYLKEKIKEKRPTKAIETPKKEPPVNLGIFSSLKTIDQLDPSHPARQYVQDRMIPGHHFKQMFYAPHFKRFVNGLIPEKFDSGSLTRDEPRLIIPFVERDRSVTGFTGRSFDPDAAVRYLAIALDRDSTRVWGLDRVNTSKTYFVLEGPLDAMFIDNSIAAGSSAIFQHMGPNAIAIFDNQPRNKEICKLLERTIEAGHRVVIWPDNVEAKDVNDLVRSGYSKEDILRLISDNTYTSLQAKMKFVSWKKV